MSKTGLMFHKQPINTLLNEAQYYFQAFACTTHPTHRNFKLIESLFNYRSSRACSKFNAPAN